MSLSSPDADGTMSLRQKSLHKRRVTKEHNSNFRAGYVHISEDQLHRTGLRGRKKYLVYFVVTLLVLAVLVNLVLTVLMLGILRIGLTGMESMELLSSPERLLFLLSSDMGDVKPIDSTIGTLNDQEMLISAVDGQEILFDALGNGPKVHVKPEATLMSTNEFTIVDPDTGHTVFTASQPSDALANSDLQHLRTSQATTNRVSSSLEDDLVLEGHDTLILTGGEGVEGDTNRLRIVARDGITLEADGIELSAEDSILLAKVQDFIVNEERTEAAGSMEVIGFKLCVGMPGGHLFTVFANATCDNS